MGPVHMKEWPAEMQKESSKPLEPRSIAINSFVCSTFEGVDTTPVLPEEFANFVVEDFVPVAFVQPDYHG